MALPIVFNNQSYAAGFVGQDNGGPSASFGYDEISGSPIVVNGTVNGVGSTVQATGIFPGASQSSTKTLYATQYDNSSQILFVDQPGPDYSTANRYVLSNRDISSDLGFSADSNGTLGDYAVCFVTGTGIRVVRDGVETDVPVEHLQVGDRAVTTAGEERPIRWIGHRSMDPRRHPQAHETQPIRIRAHAFGENRPARDLLVSPGHALAVDVLGEVLIPAIALVNGATIVQEAVERVTYWHVELDSHDLLLAEGLPAESYLDMGNRTFFAESGVVALHAGPAGGPDADPAARTHADFCRPFHGGGALVEAVRAQLQARAVALGWQLAQSDWADLHLVVDGARVEADRQGSVARFVLPAGAQEIWLVSDTSVPREVGHNADLRSLGVCLKSLSLDDGLSERRAVALDDALLCVGFHESEPGHRWTAGRARLPAALLAGCRGSVFLRLELDRPPLPRWIAPQAAAAIADATTGEAVAA